MSAGGWCPSCSPPASPCGCWPVTPSGCATGRGTATSRWSGAMRPTPRCWPGRCATSMSPTTSCTPWIGARISRPTSSSWPRRSPVWPGSRTSPAWSTSAASEAAGPIPPPARYAASEAAGRRAGPTPCRATCAPAPRWARSCWPAASRRLRSAPESSSARDRCRSRCCATSPSGSRPWSPRGGCAPGCSRSRSATCCATSSEPPPSPRRSTGGSTSPGPTCSRTRR